MVNISMKTVPGAIPDEYQLKKFVRKYVIKKSQLEQKIEILKNISTAEIKELLGMIYKRLTLLYESLDDGGAEYYTKIIENLMQQYKE